MEFGVVLLSLIPVRSQPSDKAEMVTQLLFGELVVIHQKFEEWLLIRNVSDNYEGWISNKQIERIREADFKSLKNEQPNYITELVDVVEEIESQRLFPVLFGSVIYSKNSNAFTINGKRFTWRGKNGPESNGDKFPDLFESAMMFINSPYLWGGKSAFGVDCSGFMQLIFSVNGIPLLRDASQQATLGETVNFAAEARPGDLAFFDNAAGDIVHVGMVIENHQIIHASVKVRIDTLDHQGIFNNEAKKYSHNLRVIKRIL